ncbi:MAG TPA: glycosyltransferase [Candidatus Bathyarchaeia archaeon]|nr:glycosyltransferase [Candidatus Bathyarchaeia archaeon]
MPKVSIILNVRNGAQFLREALASVLAQSFDDWELIAWDDCSTDDSARIVADFYDPRIHYYLSPEETPLGQARNLAMRQATGEWLAFLDQDDIWLPHKLQRQTALAAEGVGIIYGRAVLFDSRRGNLRDYDYAHEFQPLPEGDIFTQLFRDACFIAMSSAMLRREAVEEVGSIPEHIHVVPDYYLYVAIARHYRARAVQEVVCRYRVHAGSMSASREHRLHLHSEPLSIVKQWETQLDPRLAAYRRMTYSTALALEEMGELRSAMSGVQRLLSDGSLLWLVSRPFLRLGRAIRRRIRRPYWVATELASDPD